VLAKWLAKITKGHGFIITPNFRKRFKAVRATARANWCHDILRHSYASYHLAYFEDAAALQLQMGHVDTSMIFNNYRQRVKKSEVEKWWNLTRKNFTNYDKRFVVAKTLLTSSSFILLSKAGILIE